MATCPEGLLLQKVHFNIVTFAAPNDSIILFSEKNI